MSNWREVLRWTLGTLLCLTVSLPLRAAEPSKLTATSYGAAGEVSGSLHVLDSGNGRWMIDCGSVIGENDPSETADATGSQTQADGIAQTLPVGLESVGAVFITHAHTDHLGRLPLLVDRKFAGPVYMTEATAAIAVPMLRATVRCDRATVRQWTWSKERRNRAEENHKALWVHWRSCKYRQEIAAESVEGATCSAQALFERFEDQTPRVKVSLCSECIADHVAAVMRLARPVKLGEAVNVAPGVCARFLDAGHIPGSASVLFEVNLGDKKRRVLFSGDLGNGLSPLLPLPQPAPEVDAVFVETTYGPICRKASVASQPVEFRHTVAEAVGKGGVTWIPCFSLDRTQKILYELHIAQQEKLLPERVPIYCPSPTAKEVTAAYKKHRQSGWFLPAVAGDADAFSPNEVRTTVPSGGRLPRPCIIISTGDILVAQWMRHLLSTLLAEPSTNMIQVGYQPRGTAGERLLHGATSLDIDGQTVPIRATVHSFSCFSGHADAAQIDTWLGRVSKQAMVVLIHGNTWELESRADQLRGQGRQRVVIAKPGETIDLAQ